MRIKKNDDYYGIRNKLINIYHINIPILIINTYHINVNVFDSLVKPKLYIYIYVKVDRMFSIMPVCHAIIWYYSVYCLTNYIILY